MSRYMGRGRPFHGNFYQGQQNNNFQGRNFYDNSYSNENYATSGSSYDYNTQTYQGSSYNDNQAYQTDTDFTADTFENENLYDDQYTEDYSQNTGYDEELGYVEETGNGGSGYYEETDYNTGYGSYEYSSNNYDSYGQQASHSYHQASNVMSGSAYPGFRGGVMGRGMFGNKMQHNAQNEYSNRHLRGSSQNFGQPRPQARGRGNAPGRPFHSNGQFGKAINTGQTFNISNTNNSGKGQLQNVQNTKESSTKTDTKPPYEEKTAEIVENSDSNQESCQKQQINEENPNNKKQNEMKDLPKIEEPADRKEPSGEKEQIKNEGETKTEEPVHKNEATGEEQAKTEEPIHKNEAATEEQAINEEQSKNEKQANGEETAKEEPARTELPKDEGKAKVEEKEVPDDDCESDSSDENTDFCKYCKLNFSTPKAYHTHTRGLQHTTLVMKAKANEGDDRFQTEKVEASVLEVQIPEVKEPTPKIQSEGYDVENNWMNLDDDVIKYMQESKDPENRDLNPDDLGKNPLPDDFFCALCNVKCTGAAAFNMHIHGKQHNSNLEAVKQGAKIKKKKQASSGIMVPTTERPSKFSSLAKDTRAPLLGLEYVTEFQKSDFKAAARYVCNLCESKCDGSTIIPHVVGLKHRLNYMQIKKPQMYEHLTKFNSKKKKSEMNANLEDFASEIEAEIGRGEIKIKVELENYDDEDELKESMIRHSRELAVKVKELEEGASDAFHDGEFTSPSKLIEPPIKKPKLMDSAVDGRSRFRTDSYLDSRTHDDYYRDHYHSDSRRPPYDDPRRPPYDDDPRRPPYVDAWRPAYDDPRDPYYRRRYPDDFRASYRDRFDPYRDNDPMYERRILDERMRLDGLMAERHRLDDPYAERRRIDDIIERRRYLDQLETARVDDILERRKRLQETDVDYLRMQRFMGRETAPAASSPSLSTEEKTRLENQLARREALQAMKMPANHETDVQVIQEKLAAHKSNDPNMAARQEKAAKALKEEAAKNPHVNIAEIMTNLSSSMIATEDDAAMALQISNALTQALLKYRLQSVPKELSSLTRKIEPMLEQKPPEPSIPGLDGSTSTSSSVPSFLRTSQDNIRSPLQSTSSNTSSFLRTSQTTSSNNNVMYQASTQGIMGMSQTSDNVSYFQQPGFSDSQQQQYMSYTKSPQQSVQSNANQQLNPVATWAPVSTAYNTVTSRTTSASAGVSVPPQTLSTGKSQVQKKRSMDTSNIDQPQKLLLESIRKQTELLKQKIQASVMSAAANKSSGSSANVQNQTKHVPTPSVASTYANPYSNSSASSANQARSVSSHVTSSANAAAVSSYSSQYYQYNYHSAPPNAAPQPVPPEQPPIPTVRPVQPPLPTEPAPPLPTNDLPPLRRKHHR